MKDVKRWKGLRALIGEAVEHGASAIERVQLATAKRPFDVMEQIPGIAEPVKGIHQAHDVIVSSTYDAVRLVNRAVGRALDAALDGLSDEREPDEPADQHDPNVSTDHNGDPRL
jgi:hypothetical protein